MYKRQAIEGWFLDALDGEEARQWFREHVALRDAIVRRSTSAKTSADLELNTQVTCTLLVQQPVYADPVSYTHLDVYKRQQCDCWCIGG